jgi:hypothetical protein
MYYGVPIPIHILALCISSSLKKKNRETANNWYADLKKEAWRNSKGRDKVYSAWIQIGSKACNAKARILDSRAILEVSTDKKLREEKEEELREAESELTTYLEKMEELQKIRPTK